MKLQAKSGDTALKEVLVGDLWLGQSNRFFALRESSEGKAEIEAAAQAPKTIRLLNWRMKGTVAISSPTTSTPTAKARRSSPARPPSI